MLSTPIGRLRLVGLVEGVSFLVLLGIAMPIKYIGGHPEPVYYVGMAHGVLFVALVVAILHARLLGHITPARATGAFVASVLPVGTFVLDPYLRRDEQTRTKRVCLGSRS